MALPFTGGGNTEAHPHMTSTSSEKVSPSRAQWGENRALHTLPPPSLPGRHGHLPGEAAGAAQRGRGRTGTVPQASGTGLALEQRGSAPKAARGAAAPWLCPSSETPINPGLLASAPKIQRVLCYNPEPRRKAGNDSSAFSDMKATLHY